MASLVCIACKHANSPGDRFCAACGSSLDLKLCRACEAINNPVADHCHSCGAALEAATVLQEEAPAALGIGAEPERFRAPRVWQSNDLPASRGTRIGRALKLSLVAVLPAAAVAIAMHQFYGQAPRAKSAETPSAAEPAKQPVVAKEPIVAKQAVEAPKPPVAEVRQPVAEPKRVTKPAAVAVTVAAPAPAASAVGESAPATRGRITHTKGSSTAAAPQASPPTAPAVVATPPAAAVAATAAPSCPEPVAVLGLCNPNIKGEGK